MARPIISIDFDDSKFQKFLDLFMGYSESLDEQPEKWESLNKAMGGAGATAKESLALAAAQADLIAVHLRDATTAQSAFAKATASNNKSLSTMHESVRNIGTTGQSAWKAFSGAADASISKVGSGLAGVAEGALSALGPVGLAAGAIAAAVGGAGAAAKALADAAVTRQRSAFSKGITPGQEASFGVYGQQFMGPGALQAAANAQLNLGNIGPLSLLGIDFNKARIMTASDLAYKMLGGVVKAAQAMPDVPLENIPAVQAYRSFGGDIGDVRNALKLGPAALAASQAEEARNAGRLNLTRTAVSHAATFKKAVEGAGIAAQSFAINHLSGADPVIAQVLGALTGEKGAAASLGETIQRRVTPALHGLQHAAASVAQVFERIVGAPTLRSLSTPIVRTAAADALGSIEGSWTSVNADSGALGRWQFMPGTADAHLGKAWIAKYGSTSTARGRANFLGSPKAQTAAFNDFYGQLLHDAEKRTSDPKKILRMIALGWYGGEGSWDESQAQLNAPQTYGGHSYPSQNAYADKFEALISKQFYASQRAARSSKPAVNVHVTNSTASNVATSINATAQF